jgi:hypothetical protein
VIAYKIEAGYSLIRMPSKQKNEGKEILLLDFELFIGG